MENMFSLEPLALQRQLAEKELLECNALTSRYGLRLTEAQALSLVQHRFKALQNTGRIEFGQGILKKLVYHFCDSPFINQENYEDMLTELQDSFYYFKNESMDMLDDDELLDFMDKYFNTVCQGSLDYLNGSSLEDLCRNTRHGISSQPVDDEDSRLF